MKCTQNSVPIVLQNVGLKSECVVEVHYCPTMLCTNGVHAAAKNLNSGGETVQTRPLKGAICQI